MTFVVQKRAVFGRPNIQIDIVDYLNSQVTEYIILNTNG